MENNCDVCMGHSFKETIFLGKTILVLYIHSTIMPVFHWQLSQRLKFEFILHFLYSDITLGLSLFWHYSGITILWSLFWHCPPSNIIVELPTFCHSSALVIYKHYFVRVRIVTPSEPSILFLYFPAVSYLLTLLSNTYTSSLPSQCLFYRNSDRCLSIIITLALPILYHLPVSAYFIVILTTA